MLRSSSVPRPVPRPDRSPARRRLLHGLWWRSRFVVAALCCGLAASVVVGALRPPPPPTAPAVVTTREVPAGAVIADSDLRVDDVPAGLVPAGAAARPDAVVGRRATVALPVGTLVQPALVAGGDLAAAAPDGTVVAPVRLDPGVATLLGPGDRVDLLAAGDLAVAAISPAAPSEGQAPPSDPYLARGAVVVPAPEPDDGGGLLGSGGPGSDAVTLVAVRPEEAVRLASVSGQTTVTAVLVP
ncbi:SAF domain-containing protein [Cellulosimicrobium protaetiae]|uniref:Flagellar biosynthesis protein FlgA n=1 Tax=Cellulosimicrobium protaetiae TaxID=2587808 RepID=A0A6M5UCD3_9MICO|nr:SAF domain-containing protein [Cellulosimicrobium protaetiae]QJW35910.1 flagellar biosynthesis protein FlgA [Cellulosimicrobium protaetiae]